MTGTELLVDAPRMARDLRRARAENARLRAALARLGASDDAPASGDAQQASDEDEGEDEGGKKAASRPERAVQEQEEQRFAGFGGWRRGEGERFEALELKNAEEKVAQLERRLLDAEETMCHLRAEKMAALRDCERLQIALEAAAHSNASGASDLESDDGGVDQAMRRLVLELQAKLSDAEKDRAVEQEQHMAVIREQEEEIQALSAAAEDKDLELAALREKYLDAVQEIQLAADMEAIDASVASSVKDQPDYNEEEEPTASPEILDWREELVRHPTPHFDLDSPEVQYLLHTWTGNVKKLHYLRLWFSRVATTRGPLPEDFPLGIELPRLTPEVRDGFLALVVPLLRRQTEREIQVHSRRYNDPLHSDLRIRVVPRR